jgi:anti-anti-sigma factor
MTETITSREADRAFLRPGGDVVSTSLGELRGLMRGMINDGVRDLVLDFVNVQMLDSRGIGLLISAHNSLRAVGGRLSLTHASKEISDLLRTMRLHQHLGLSGD